jgi:hypothetical protein
MPTRHPRSTNGEKAPPQVIPTCLRWLERIHPLDDRVARFVPSGTRDEFFASTLDCQLIQS